MHVQPKRGCFGARCDGQVCKILHDPDCPPPHQYLATYHWIEDIFGADVIVQVGTHGNLEFLPGKGVGLSEECFPDVVTGDVPFLYVYNADNPPEGTIAKRRGYAVTCRLHADRSCRERAVWGTRRTGAPARPVRDGKKRPCPGTRPPAPDNRCGDSGKPQQGYASHARPAPRRCGEPGTRDALKNPETRRSRSGCTSSANSRKGRNGSNLSSLSSGSIPAMDRSAAPLPGCLALTCPISSLTRTGSPKRTACWYGALLEKTDRGAKQFIRAVLNGSQLSPDRIFSRSITPGQVQVLNGLRTRILDIDRRLGESERDRFAPCRV